MRNYFEECSRLIRESSFDRLSPVSGPAPQLFNWVTEIFEGIHLQQRPAARALTWTNGTDTLHFSFAALSRSSNQLLNFLRRRGAAPGDVLYTQLPLCPENWTCYLAAIKGGMPLAPAAPLLNVHDLVYRFGKLQPRVIISDPESAARIEEAELASGHSAHIRVLIHGSREGWYNFTDIDMEPAEATAANTKADDPLFLFFTSGTTGMPKVVTHAHLHYPLGHLSTAAWLGLTDKDIHYNIAQPGWAKFAWSSFFAPWNTGACIFSYTSPGRFHAATQLRMIREYGVTSFCAPPTVWRMFILENLDHFSSSLRNCVSAGEPLNPEIIDTWLKKTGITIRDGYGQTETTCLVANLPGQPVKPGSMGKPVFLYDIHIVDDEGNPLPVTETGNVAVRLSSSQLNGLLKGYYQEPERDQLIFRHGFYYTGDKANFDEDGYLWFVGRDDDVIKTSDYRVGPFEIESMLLEHPAVAESAVVGSPHAVKGFIVKAFILLAPGYTGSEELAHDIFSFARKNIAPYKMPRLIEFAEEFPKTISGKIRRVELRMMEAQQKATGQKKAGEFEYRHTEEKQ